MGAGHGGPHVSVHEGSGTNSPQSAKCSDGITQETMKNPREPQNPQGGEEVEILRMRRFKPEGGWLRKGCKRGDSDIE